MSPSMRVLEAGSDCITCTRNKEATWHAQRYSHSKQDFTRTLVKHHPWLKTSHPPPPSGKATSRDFKHEPCRSSPQRRPTAKPRISTGGAEMEPALNRADKGKLALGSGHNHHRPASGLTLPLHFLSFLARELFSSQIIGGHPSAPPLALQRCPRSPPRRCHSHCRMCRCRLWPPALLILL